MRVGVSIRGGVTVIESVISTSIIETNIREEVDVEDHQAVILSATRPTSLDTGLFSGNIGLFPV
jgi:hypothetical protein